MPSLQPSDILFIWVCDSNAHFADLAWLFVFCQTKNVLKMVFKIGKYKFGLNGIMINSRLWWNATKEKQLHSIQPGYRAGKIL